MNYFKLHGGGHCNGLRHLCLGHDSLTKITIWDDGLCCIHILAEVSTCFLVNEKTRISLFLQADLAKTCAAFANGFLLELPRFDMTLRIIQDDWLIKKGRPMNSMSTFITSSAKLPPTPKSALHQASLHSQQCTCARKRHVWFCQLNKLVLSRKPAFVCFSWNQS